MSNPTRKHIQALIRANGGELVRDRKHLVYRFPDDRTFVMATTPSDWRAEANNIARLRKFLGIEREIKKNPERKAKHKVEGEPEWKGIASGVKMHNWQQELSTASKLLRRRVRYVYLTERRRLRQARAMAIREMKHV